MRNAIPLARKAVLIRCFTMLAASAALAGCAMHQGERNMQMDTMRESPMHQMMEDMGCAHDPADMKAMETMSKEEKHAHMKAHMQACMTKLRQRAVDDAMAKIDSCVDARMHGRAHKRTSMKNMRAMMMADLRACASQAPAPETAPAKPTTHDGH